MLQFERARDEEGNENGETDAPHQQVYQTGEDTKDKIVKSFPPRVTARVMNIAHNDFSANDDDIQRRGDQHEKLLMQCSHTAFLSKKVPCNPAVFSNLQAE
jgi:hypothetical protein